VYRVTLEINKRIFRCEDAAPLRADVFIVESRRARARARSRRVELTAILINFSVTVRERQIERSDVFYVYV